MKRILLALLLLTTSNTAHADVPQDGWMVWSSNRKGGSRQIYLMRVDDPSSITQLTTGGGEFPAWSPDGSWIAYRHSDLTTHVVRPDKSEDKSVFAGEFVFWMQDGSGLVAGQGESYYLINPDTGKSQLLFKKSDFTRLGAEKFTPGGITHDGRYLLAFSGLYKGGYTGDNGTFGNAAIGVGHNNAIVLDFQNKDKVYFFGYGCEPTAPPSGDWIYHIRGDKTHATYPDIYRMKLADLLTRSSYSGEMEHADADWGHEYFVRISTNNTWITYGATTGCHDHETCDYEIFIHRIGAGSDNRTRLTTHTGNDTWPHLYVGKLWQSPAAKIALSPSTLSFTAQEGGAALATKSIAVSNAGGSTLAAVDTSITYGVGSGWLSVQASGSGDAQTLQNSVDISGLSPNTYSATVAVSAADATNSPQTYSVTLVVEGQPRATTEPQIALSPAQLSFTVTEGKTVAAKVVAVENSGEQTLADVTTTIEFLSGGDWLKVEASGAGNAQSLSNAIDAAGLAPNTYAATVSVSSAGADNSPQSYAVSLTVLPAISTGEVHLKINSGGGDTVDGWSSDQPYRTGGASYTFKDATVDLNGQPDPAPEAVYTTCIHQNHSYSFPVPNGTYRVRMHFFDTHGDSVRAMDYRIEGETLIDDFSVTTAAGGTSKALVKEFVVQVSDGDGLQIEGDEDQGGDVFESGIEILSVAEEPEPDTGPGAAVDAGGSAATPDAGVGGDGGSTNSLSPELGGGCAVTSDEHAGAGFALLSLLLALAWWRRTTRRRRSC